MAKFNQKETLKKLIETATEAETTLKEEMGKLADHFGESPLGPTKEGGLNRSAFREGAKLETKQKEADRIGLSLDDAESLAWIIAGVNAHRSTLWQTYQIAYFGLEKIKPTKPPAPPKEKTEAEIEREQQANYRKECMAAAKENRNEARIKRAEATIASASGNKDLAGELKREAEAFDKSAKYYASDAKRLAEEIAESKEGDKKAKLIDKLIAVRDEIKAAKVLDGDINAMTITEILEYLV